MSFLDNTNFEGLKGHKLQQYKELASRAAGCGLRQEKRKIKINKLKLMLEPCAVKVARTVLRGGKPERAYLSQLDTPVVLAENAECHRLP